MLVTLLVPQELFTNHHLVLVLHVIQVVTYVMLQLLLLVTHAPQDIIFIMVFVILFVQLVLQLVELIVY